MIISKQVKGKDCLELKLIFVQSCSVRERVCGKFNFWGKKITFVFVSNCLEKKKQGSSNLKHMMVNEAAICVFLCTLGS